jgi:hypothetical protein
MTEQAEKVKTPEELIQDELGKFSWKTKREFERLFPCKNALCTIEVYSKEYLAEQKHFRIMKMAQGEEFYATIKPNYCPETISYENVEDFWSRWKKFKRVISFMNL